MPWFCGGRRFWPRAKCTATFAGLFTRALRLILLLVPREADSAALSMGSQHLFSRRHKGGLTGRPWPDWKKEKPGSIVQGWPVGETGFSPPPQLHLQSQNCSMLPLSKPHISQMQTQNRVSSNTAQLPCGEARNLISRLALIRRHWKMCRSGLC